MDEKSLQTLEFGKIRDRLTTYTNFSAGEDLARQLHPTTDQLEAELWQAQTREAVAMFASHPTVTIGGARDVRRALGSLALYGGALALVLLPQMRANERAGFGLGLGANRWWNLELALRTPARVVAPEGIDDPYGLARWELQRALTDDYMATSTDPLVRERAARERVRAHLAAEGWGAAVSEQLTEFLDVLLARGGLSFYRAPCLEQALGYRARWGAPPPGWIAALARPARPLWWLLLAVGTFGLARGCRRGAGEPLEGDPAGDRGGYLLVLALALCVLAVVLAVPLKFRFLQPLIPLLCLGVGAVCARRPSSARV